MQFADSISLDLLLGWNLATPAFRLRGLLAGHKQGILSFGGMLHAFALAMSLTSFVITAVMLGYYEVFLVPTVLVVASVITFLTKSAVDHEFRTWGLGPRLTVYSV